MGGPSVHEPASQPPPNVSRLDPLLEEDGDRVPEEDWVRDLHHGRLVGRRGREGLARAGEGMVRFRREGARAMTGRAVAAVSGCSPATAVTVSECVAEASAHLEVERDHHALALCLLQRRLVEGAQLGHVHPGGVDHLARLELDLGLEHLRGATRRVTSAVAVALRAVASAAVKAAVRVAAKAAVRAGESGGASGRARAAARAAVRARAAPRSSRRS